MRTATWTCLPAYLLTLGVDAMKSLDAVIIGAGQAGLAASYFLCQDHREHIVFERGRIGESWLSQRWDSFRLNTPNFMNALPGLPYAGPEPGAFCTTADLIRQFQGYAEQFHLPVHTGVEVVSVSRLAGEQLFAVDTTADGQAREPLLSRSIVVACGIQRNPKLPALHSQLPASITQLHTVTYRNPAALSAGAVVIVGSGQSGCQIAEDLLEAGRQVYMCTSKVMRV